MAVVQITLNVEATVTSVRIDPIGPQLLLEGVVRDVDHDVVVREFSENVTAQLSATQLAQIQAIAVKAQQWVDNRLATA